MCIRDRGMDNLVELGRIFGVPVDAILRPDSRLPESESAEPENLSLIHISRCGPPNRQ